MYVRTKQARISLSLVRTYVHTFFTWNKKFILAVNKEHDLQILLFLKQVCYNMIESHTTYKKQFSEKEIYE